MNISSLKFSFNTFKLLNKGLSFCPRPKLYDKEQFGNDCKAFFRRIKLRAHFGINEFQPDILDILNNKKSSWTPSNPDPTVETFIAVVLADINKNPQKHLPYDNLSKGERNALEELSNNENIIVTRADKGGAIVIWGIQQYLTEANNQLSNTTFYQKLNNDPSKDYAKLITNSFHEMKNSKAVAMSEGP